MSEPSRGGLERLELRVERLKVTFRFTFAFHAREVRFERDEGQGYERVFPETFSFHRERHDPMELSLQLDDLLRKPRLLSSRAHRRDSGELVSRLLSQAPRYLQSVAAGLDQSDLPDAARMRIHQDIALLCQLLMRFMETRDLDAARPVRVAVFLLRKQIYFSLMVLVRGRVEPEWLERWVAGEVKAVDPTDDPSESGFFHALESSDSKIVDRMLVRMAERAFYMWLDGICLDEENQAFEKEDSPFGTREEEVLAAIRGAGSTRLERGTDFVVFLRRRSRDGLRILKKLDGWFLRQYDIRHASTVIELGAMMERGEPADDRTLSWHTPRLHALAVLVLVSPFVSAIFAYDSAPRFFDVLCSVEILLINLVAIWFLLYRFCWKRDLSFFHAAVPRIGAGIVVGYLPVLFIDEVWDLAGRSIFTVATLGALLGLITLLYIYVEVERRLGDTALAFARARAIFVLGSVEAFGFGMVITSLVGRIMVSRNWSPAEGGEIPVAALRDSLEPLIGQLPPVIGVAPLYAFPASVLLMTFLSFFIGVFLQLMWEELPITEPL